MNPILKLSIVIGFIVLLGAAVFVMINPKMPKTYNSLIPEPVVLVSTTTPLAPEKEVIVEKKIQAATLSIGETFILPTGTLTFVGPITDSRCPKGVQCIWAGEVKFGLKYTNKTNLLTSDAVLTYPELRPIIIDTYEIHVVSVAPEKTSNPINDKNYKFTITIKDLTKTDIVPPSSKELGIISGTVLVGPMCPVVREGVDCPDKGASAVVLSIVNVKSGVSYSAITNNTGAFILSVPAGVYIINGSTKLYPRISPTEVRVISGENTAVVISADSGIR